MKRFSICLAASVAALALAPAAQAAPTITPGSSIDLTGYVRANGGSNLGGATSLDFVSGPGAAASPGVAGVVSTFGSGTGTFAGLMCTSGSCGAIQDISDLMVGTQTINSFLSLFGGNAGSPINFDLTGITSIGRSNPNFLTVSATGNIRYDGFDSTPATFLFSAQGGKATSFSATTLAGGVPEPATWALMILGFGAVGYSMRSRRRNAAVSIA